MSYLYHHHHLLPCFLPAHKTQQNGRCMFFSIPPPGTVGGVLNPLFPLRFSLQPEGHVGELGVVKSGVCASSHITCVAVRVFPHPTSSTTQQGVGCVDDYHSLSIPLFSPHHRCYHCHVLVTAKKSIIHYLSTVDHTLL